jgi:hypothetical protein
MQGTGDRLGFVVRDVALRSIASWVMRVQGACGGIPRWVEEGHMHVYGVTCAGTWCI